MCYYKTLNADKRKNGAIFVGLRHHKGLFELRSSQILPNLYFKIYSILVKISCYKPLNAQGRENVSILGGFDNTWAQWALVGVKFEVVELGQPFYFEHIFYFGHNLLL